MARPVVRLPVLAAGDYIGPKLSPNAVSVVDHLTPLWCDARSWQARMALADVSLAHATRPGADRRHEYGATTLVFTALCEELGETEITCIEAASIYWLTLHTPWAHAAATYAKSLPEGAVDTFLAAHPAWVAFLEAASTLLGDTI